MAKNRKDFTKYISNVTIVVPAYNEAPRIVHSVKPLLDMGLKIIIVDDASNDNTLDVLNSFLNKHNKYKKLIEIVKHEKNKGKARAMYTGLQHVKTQYVLFWDADIQDYNVEKFKECFYTFMYYAEKGDNTTCGEMMVFTSYRILVDYINQRALTGERLLKTSVAKNIFDQFLRKYTKRGHGYLIETYFNYYFFKNKKKISECILNFKHFVKTEKFGIKGTIKDLKMAFKLLTNKYFFAIIMALIFVRSCKKRNLTKRSSSNNISSNVNNNIESSLK